MFCGEHNYSKARLLAEFPLYSVIFWFRLLSERYAEIIHILATGVYFLPLTLRLFEEEIGEKRPVILV